MSPATIALACVAVVVVTYLVVGRLPPISDRVERRLLIVVVAAAIVSAVLSLIDGEIPVAALIIVFAGGAAFRSAAAADVPGACGSRTGHVMRNVNVQPLDVVELTVQSGRWPIGTEGTVVGSSRCGPRGARRQFPSLAHGALG